MNKSQVLAFIESQTYAVIATCGNDQCPEAALIGFGETDDFEIIFGTSSKSRKYANIKVNAKVALVIGWSDDNITVQYEGIAEEIPDSMLEKYLYQYHVKVPSATKYQNLPEQVYFRVAPRWVRYSDFSGEEEKVYEFLFNQTSKAE